LTNFMKSILKEDPKAEFRFWGGDLMQAVGGTIVKHYRDLAFMGFVEVLLNLFTILKNIKLCKQDILEYKPDVLVFIDYPGFNLRIAEWAKEKGFRTHYYISPQIWAWKEGRIKTIKKCVDMMYVILPFEKSFYEDKHQFPVQFVGHPLIDAIADHEQIMPETFKKRHNLDDRPIIAILPGSRKQEIRKMLEVMLTVVDEFPDIAKRIINLDYISLVNLIMDKEVVTELIQGDFNTKKLKEELTKITDSYNRAVMFLDYYDLEQELGGKGANDKTAKLIVESLK